MYLWCQVGAVTLAFYWSFFIQAVTGYKGWKLSFVLVFLITSQRSCNSCVHFDILTNGPHLCTTGTFMVLGRAFFVLDKYKNSVGIFAKFPLLRQLDQLRFLQLAISWSQIMKLGIYFSMPMSVDHCWTTPYFCTNGDVDLLQRHSYSPISDWWHRFILEYGDQLHLSRLFNSQHYI